MRGGREREELGRVGRTLMFETDVLQWTFALAHAANMVDIAVQQSIKLLYQIELNLFE